MKKRKGQAVTVETNKFANNPFEEPTGYQPWEVSKSGMVANIIFFPRRGSPDLQRIINTVQVIDMELAPDESELVVMFHTSGQIVRILGHGLGELMGLLSEKKAKAVHVWDGKGQPPEKAVTGLQFAKTFGQLLGED
mgnify:CR=1 FL=1